MKMPFEIMKDCLASWRDPRFVQITQSVSRFILEINLPTLKNKSPDHFNYNRLKNGK